jgi:hypothetical protein
VVCYSELASRKLSYPQKAQSTQVSAEGRERAEAGNLRETSMHLNRTGANVAAVALASFTLLAGLPADSEAADDDRAQNSSQAQPQAAVPDRRADFLFGRPSRSVSVRGSWLFASAKSDLFAFVTDQLTIDKKDFNAPGFSAYFSQALTTRLDIQGGYEYAKSAKPSEYRRFVDNNFNAIEQDTSLKTSHIVGSVRFSLTPRGRDVSRFAYVPSRVVPYVGAGGGAVYYEFTQTGDFVDFVDLHVFPDVFRSSGWAPSGHAFAGVDLQVYRTLYASIEGRYTKSSAKLSSDFIDFDPIDLSGFKVSAGINLVF